MSKHLLIVGVSAALALSARATVLVFERTSGVFPNFVFLPQGYGNRVAAADQDGFHYGLDGGPTPNVVVQHSTGGLPQLYTWDLQFGDLQHVVFAQEPRVFDMFLQADPGYVITLTSFDMAAWPFLDYSIRSVTVLDGGANVLFFQSPCLIEGDPNGPQHTHFDFGAGLTAPAIRIMFDSTNVDSDDVGIDNIAFSQTALCGTADFNCDGDIGTDSDIEAFFACLAGNCPAPPCPSTADFNGDGDIGTDADIESFFRVLAGGTC